MSLIKLTQNLENFQWTDYSKAGTGKSPQQDGTDYFERPNPKSLDQMESKFGPIDRSSNRGPYGTVDYMDGTKQGRGFTPPGGHPLGFNKDMDLIYSFDRSRLVLNGDISRLPLSHNVAGMNSALSYGIVSNQGINLEPAAGGAYGVTTLPISTYTSRQNLEGYTIGAVGGYNTYYGTIDSFSSKSSKFQKPDGSYTTPTGDEFTKPGSGYLMNLLSGTTYPSFEGGQRTFIIPAAYPENTSAYTIDSQLGWSHLNKFLEISGGPWGVLPNEWVETKTVTTTVPYTEEDMTKAENYMGGHVDDWMATHPQTYTTTQTITHPIQPINLHSVPNYNAPSWLELQFLTNYSNSAETWPYKVLSFGEEGTHPFIRKDVGERYPVGQGVENWMALQVARTFEDIDRLNTFLETPKGALWTAKQVMLQLLNPRDETRTVAIDNIVNSASPLVHAKRHAGIYGGETYMELADFGPLVSDTPTTQGAGFMSILAGLWSGGIFANGLSGDLKIGTGRDTDSDPAADLGIAVGTIDFNEQGAGGRLRYLTSKFIVGDSISGLAGFVASADPFGRTPKVPKQTTFSQKGAYGRGNANENSSGTVLQRYQTLAYGRLEHSSGYGGKLENEGIMSPSEVYKFDDDPSEQLEFIVKSRDKSRDIVKDIGQQGRPLDPEIYESTYDDSKEGAGLGIINKGPEGKYNNKLTDKINMLPYGQDYKDSAAGTIPDFIKFKFKDLVNDKFIIFRAILSGISDSITPEWSGTRYIGRPDQVYVYSGTERKISFSFDIYPKTKQEFPVLMEKLNYLIGLCYPTYTAKNRMIAPFIQLTLGDMFNDTPGFLDSLSITVNDSGTWEIEDGLQFPKHITCACDFTYIGKYLPSSLGKHYELGWLDDQGWTRDKDGNATTRGTFVGAEGDNKYPERIQFGGENGDNYNMEKLFSDLEATNA